MGSNPSSISVSPSLFPLREGPALLVGIVAHVIVKAVPVRSNTEIVAAVRLVQSKI